MDRLVKRPMPPRRLVVTIIVVALGEQLGALRVRSDFYWILSLDIGDFPPASSPPIPPFDDIVDDVIRSLPAPG